MLVGCSVPSGWEQRAARGASALGYLSEGDSDDAGGVPTPTVSDSEMDIDDGEGNGEEGEEGDGEEG